MCGSVAAPTRETNDMSNDLPASMPPQTWPAPISVAAGPTIVVSTGRPEAGFRFDGGAGSYLLVGIGATLLALFTLGLALPWAICLQYRWRTEHTIINGRRLRFTGTGGGLFGNWIKWWALTIVTIGIYLFWVVPRLTRWTVEHQDFS